MNKLHFSIGLLLASPLSAQSSQSSGSDYVMYGLILLCVVLVIWAILTLASNLIKIEANKYGIDAEKNKVSIFPSLSDFLQAKRPKYADGGSFTALSKGYDIKLEGGASGPVEKVEVSRFALQPADFNGMSPIPKVEVEVGSEVLAGDVLFYDKKRPEIKYVSPVSGEIVAINRGDKRAISEIVVLADKTMRYQKRNIPNIDQTSREDLITFFAESGLLALINERPFDMVPKPSTIPVNIFISSFDTAPMAPDNNLVIQGQEAAFHKGIEVLSKLTSGKVHVGLSANGSVPPSTAFTQAPMCEKHWFKGPHPAGNVGIQIHHIAPIKGSDKVWTVGVQEVVSIGQMFLTGEYRADRVVTITGAELLQPKVVRTYQGASVSDLLKGNVKGENNRIVSGDVLSGKQTEAEGYLHFRSDQITVLKEGNEYELFGWLLPLAPRPSISGTIPSYGGKDHLFEANTNTHGEKRAFVVSGQYETVLPMDIYPQHLMKAILAKDFERMEGLGIMELSEEDVALCEFVCTSKNPVQSILRQGLKEIQEQS